MKPKNSRRQFERLASDLYLGLMEHDPAGGYKNAEVDKAWFLWSEAVNWRQQTRKFFEMKQRIRELEAINSELGALLEERKPDALMEANATLTHDVARLELQNEKLLAKAYPRNTADGEVNGK